MYTYLFINIFTISIPFAFSFERKVSFYKDWKYLFPAIILTGSFFIVWDHIFTNLGVWDFNKKYLTGIHLFDLPLGEWLFFFTVPYACVFIYVSLNYYVKKDVLKPVAKYITFPLIFVLVVMALFNTDKLYTFYNFIFTAAFLFIHWLIFKYQILGRFYFAYLVHLIPFFIVNGILTYLPIVTYNNAENLGLRFGSIPVEDSIYSLLLLLINITLYELLKKSDGKYKQNLPTKS